MGGKIASIVLDKNDRVERFSDAYRSEQSSYLSTANIGAEAIEHETKVQLEAARI